VRSISIRFLAGLLVGVVITLGALSWLQPDSMNDQERAMAIRMRSFVRALSAPPMNEQPAKQWRVLLNGNALLNGAGSPDLGGLSCTVCHGSVGEGYARAIARGELDDGEQRPAPAVTRERMVQIMEDWVEQLNHDAGPFLRKAVVCTDCHDRDPRRE
jgi:hypothetical protein